jgi:hypothetical protein
MKVRKIRNAPFAQFVFQGALTKCHYKQPLNMQSQAGGGKRGVISEFSRQSRKRLLDLFARMRQNPQMVFLTLTYGQCWPAPAEAKAHYRALMERIRRRYPNVAAVWRIEYQQRGAPHFHIIFYGLPFIPKHQIARVWHEIIGDVYADWSSGHAAPPFTRIEMIKSRRKAMSYVSKYVGKMDAHQPAPPSGSGFNYATYLHAGRYWGVHNRGALPFAENITVTVALIGGAQKVFHDMRRYVRRKWVGNKTTRVQGWTIYSDATQWHELLHYTLMQHAPIAMSPQSYAWRTWRYT